MFIILYFEIVPIRMTFGIGITPNKAIVFVGLNFDREVKIPAFKVGVEVYTVLERTRVMRVGGGVDRGIFFSYFFDCLSYCVNFYFIFFAILPPIAIFFMEMDRINVARAAVDDLISGVCIDFEDDCLY